MNERGTEPAVDFVSVQNFQIKLSGFKFGGRTKTKMEQSSWDHIQYSSLFLIVPVLYVLVETRSAFSLNFNYDWILIMS